jgi:hypothetical protein
VRRASLADLAGLHSGGGVVNLFQIVVRKPTGVELLTVPMEIGQTVQWVADAPGTIVCFQVFVVDLGAPAMALILRRNGARVRLEPVDTTQWGDRSRTRFMLLDRLDHVVNPGDDWKATVEAVHEVDLASAKPCEFCGRTVVQVKGDPMHKEPVCEPWMKRDREQRAAKLN